MQESDDHADTPAQARAAVDLETFRTPAIADNDLPSERSDRACSSWTSVRVGRLLPAASSSVGALQSSHGPFPDQLPLEVGESGHDPEQQPAPGGGGVDSFGEAAEPEVAFLEVGDGVDQVGEASAEPVDVGRRGRRCRLAYAVLRARIETLLTPYFWVAESARSERNRYWSFSRTYSIVNPASSIAVR